MEDDNKSMAAVSVSVGGPEDVIDDMRRFLHKRASKSPMGRDTDMSNINSRLRILDKEVKGLYDGNVQQEK